MIFSNSALALLTLGSVMVQASPLNKRVVSSSTASAKPSSSSTTTTTSSSPTPNMAGCTGNFIAFGQAYSCSSALSTTAINNGSLMGAYIPTTIAYFQNLKHLRLPRDHLTGSVPTELGLLTNLVSLDLSNGYDNVAFPPPVISRRTNQGLTGCIPTEIGLLNSLSYLNLAVNSLSGTIPTELGLLANLATLDLSNNLLTGTIPFSFNKLLAIKNVLIKGNPLTGIVPQIWSSPTTVNVQIDLPPPAPVNGLSGTGSYACQNNLNVCVNLLDVTNSGQTCQPWVGYGTAFCAGVPDFNPITGAPDNYNCFTYYSQAIANCTQVFQTGGTNYTFNLKWGQPCSAINISTLSANPLYQPVYQPTQPQYAPTSVYNPPSPTYAPYGPSNAYNPYAPTTANNPYVPTTAYNPYAPTTAVNPYVPTTTPYSPANPYVPTTAGYQPPVTTYQPPIVSAACANSASFTGAVNLAGQVSCQPFAAQVSAGCNNLVVYDPVSGTSPRASCINAATAAVTSCTQVVGTQSTYQFNFMFNGPNACGQSSQYVPPTSAAAIYGTPVYTTAAAVYGTPVYTTAAAVYGTPVYTTAAAAYGTPVYTTAAAVYGTPTYTPVVAPAKNITTPVVTENYYQTPATTPAAYVAPVTTPAVYVPPATTAYQLYSTAKVTAVQAVATGYSPSNPNMVNDGYACQITLTQPLSMPQGATSCYSYISLGQTFCNGVPAYNPANGASPHGDCLTAFTSLLNTCAQQANAGQTSYTLSLTVGVPC